MRLNKYLSEAGICSRREADRLIESGRVIVDGRRAEPGMQVTEENDVRVGKKRIESQAEKVVLAVNKPAGIVCTEDMRERKNIIRFLNYPVRITYAGRLDKDSEGLLIMTNDGDLINAMMRARYRHEKEYKVTVNKPVTDEFIERLKRGVHITDKEKNLDVVTLPCKARRLGKYTFSIVLTQGLNRQIRRMCGALGYKVERLIRVRIINIELGNLKSGEVRKLTKQELKDLYEQTKADRIKELVELLNRAGKAYYQDAEEIMSDYAYDKLYDELKELEEELGITLAGSPTVNVGYEVLSELPKERHESPMLSLDKTKEVEELKKFIGDQKVLMSWKLDGLTIVLTYRDGNLFKAVTRGNGEVGEVITNNAKVFKNVPLQIAYKGELILRGEAVISYKDFERINARIEDVDARYKNPRNLCSGSVRQLNNEITAQRNVRFYAFSLVQAEDVDFKNSRECQMEWLKAQGFETVEYHMVTADTAEAEVQDFSGRIADNAFPSDGLVLVYDDIAYGQSLGRTSKFPRDSFAFKWADEIRETKLLEIEWSPSRTGLINPVAIFEPVELEGTTVSRASVHNISIMEELELGVGDKIEVYKANMIIPQIAGNLTKSGVRDIPKVCPVCGERTEIKKVSNAKALYCTNPECQAKHVKSFSLFVSRDALNIEGLSEATLEKFIARGFIREFSDIFHLDRYSEEIRQMEGFGEKSYTNLIASVQKARQTTLPRVIYSLGIAGIGLANAKVICKEFKNDVNAMLHADEETLNAIDGIGGVLAGTFVSYFKDENHIKILLNLLKELEIPEEIVDNTERILEGKKFVITGSVTHFANRGEVKELIESLGGKVTGSVTAKTDYLINNDVHSTSSKNKKANELNIPIISEEDFIKMTQQAE